MINLLLKVDNETEEEREKLEKRRQFILNDIEENKNEYQEMDIIDYDNFGKKNLMEFSDNLYHDGSWRVTSEGYPFETKILIRTSQMADVLSSLSLYGFYASRIKIESSLNALISVTPRSDL
jgi:hypothetical protein